MGIVMKGQHKPASKIGNLNNKFVELHQCKFLVLIMHHSFARCYYWGKTGKELSRSISTTECQSVIY